MRILTMVDKKKIAVSEKPVPKAESGHALIKVSYAGICGSDWHMVWGNGVRAGQNAVAGHEFSGVIVDPSDTHFKAGSSTPPAANVNTATAGKNTSARSGSAPASA